MKKIIFSLLLIFTLQLQAQDKISITEEDYNNTEVKMADRLRADGKIYVVVLVVSIIMIGILSYVIVIDQKLKKIEREIDKNE